MHTDGLAAGGRDIKMSEKRGIPFYFNVSRKLTTWTRPSL